MSLHPDPGTLLQAVVWRREPDGAMLERAELRGGPQALSLRGRVVGALDAQPFEVAYGIDDDGERANLVLIQHHGAAMRTLELLRGPAGWRRDGRDAPDLMSCFDVDLGVSPSTNLLPIRRLGASDAFEIRVAWVRFPSLDVAVSRQSYERLGERRWRYRNLDSGFSAEIEVDHFGLPVAYAGVWSRIATLER